MSNCRSSGSLQSCQKPLAILFCWVSSDLNVISVEQIFLESLFPREIPWVPNTCQLSVCQNHTLRQELNVGKHKCPEKFRPETELTQQTDRKILDATKKKDLQVMGSVSILMETWFMCRCKSQRRGLLLCWLTCEYSLSVSTSAYPSLKPFQDHLALQEERKQSQ